MRKATRTATWVQISCSASWIKSSSEEWVKSGEARRPAGIVDTRTYARPEPGAAS